MEKKNVIFLSVIAVATLLTAVIGTTFAYFTATINSNGTGAVNVTTKTIAGASMALGDTITVTDALPGFKKVKTMTVTGSGAADSQGANATITVTPNIAEQFAEDVSWVLYKSKTAIECESHPVTDGTKYYDNATCTGIESATKVIEGTTEAKSENIVVNYNTSDNYYLVLSYKNYTDKEQNTQQGKTFSVKMSFAAKA